ncbi:hypothetical protein HYS91_02555 [Candidatus Daviesbacteria bacterium]|nr:hypothetical protein [Candidatus Daviesbacteria bacterium]
MNPEAVQPSAKTISKAAAAKQTAGIREAGATERTADINRRLTASAQGKPAQAVNLAELRARFAIATPMSYEKPQSQFEAFPTNQPPSPIEDRDSPELERLRELATQVEETIKMSHGLENEDLPRIAEHLWDGTDDELKALTRRSTLNPKASNYTIAGRDQSGQGIYSDVVYLSPKIRESLSNASAESLSEVGTTRSEFQALIEEVSHFVYKNYYRQLYGSNPHSASVELVAVLDEYNVFQYLSRAAQGRTLSIEEHLATMEQYAAAYNPEYRSEGEYIVGHELGSKYLLYLNRLHNSGQDAGAELGRFYRLTNRQQLEYLFYNIGLRVEHKTKNEQQEVARVFSEISSLQSSVSNQPQSNGRVFTPNRAA